MSGYKLFLSHSSKDQLIANAFVDFMYSIGLTENDVFCSSDSSSQIPLHTNIYDYLNGLLSNDELYVVFFLSDNYYASPICLNEMGAAWLKRSKSLNFLLPGFDFNDIQGVANNNHIGIKLGVKSDEIFASFNNFRDDLEQLFNIKISNNRWEKERNKFLDVTIQNSRVFNMALSQSYCVGDLENYGCKIIKLESNQNKITAQIDFNETDSKLSSIVIFMDSHNFINHYTNKRNLCFDIYANNNGISEIQIEMHLDNVDMSVDIPIKADITNYKIPLSQFCDALTPWKRVSEIAFLIHKRKVSSPVKIVIENLRLE